MHVVVWYLFIWATIQRKDHESHYVILGEFSIIPTPLETLTFVQLEALEVFFLVQSEYTCVINWKPESFTLKSGSLQWIELIETE